MFRYEQPGGELLCGELCREAGACSLDQSLHLLVGGQDIEPMYLKLYERV